MAKNDGSLLVCLVFAGFLFWQLRFQNPPHPKSGGSGVQSLSPHPSRNTYRARQLCLDWLIVWKSNAIGG